MPVTYTQNPDENNHLRTDYNVDKIFLNFPNQQKSKTFVNGTASERVIPAGTLVGLTTADQTIAQELASGASDGSEIPYGFTLNDITIPAGALEEVEGLVGIGDNQSSIFEDKVILDGSDTLETVITTLGISIASAIRAYCLVKLEPAADNLSDYKDAQV